MNKRALLNKCYNYYSKLAYALPYGYAPLPPLIVWEITMKCNLRCAMCPFYGRHAISINTKNEMTFNDIKKAIDGIKKDYSKLPYLPFIGITGGEAFLRKDIIDIFEYLKKNGFKFSVTTNFSTIDEQLAKKIANSGISDLRVSIDGPQQIHDKIRGMPVFEKVLRSVSFIRNSSEGKKLPIKLNCTISRANMSYLGYMVELAHKLNADLSFQYIQFLDDSHINAHKSTINHLLGSYYPTKVDIDSFTEGEVSLLVDNIKKAKALAMKNKVNISFTPELSVDEIRPYFLDLKNYRHSDKCCFPWSTARINSQGDVFPCIDYFYGNLKKESFAKIWNNKMARHFRRALKKAGLFPGCIRCCKI